MTDSNSKPQESVAPSATIAGRAVPLSEIFRRFIRFGFTAWGGPAVQIAALRHELVDEQRWISSERFNRVLAVYQVLPGPEATELCVYFGFVKAGRLGAILAGLCFVLPGLVLMLALSWAYVHFDFSHNALFVAAFAGMKAAVAALIVRAIHRIGGHALHDRWLFLIAAFSFVADLFGAPFAVTLPLAGAMYIMFKRGWEIPGILLGSALCFAAWFFAPILVSPELAPVAPPTAAVAQTVLPTASLLTFFWTGLKAGLLTFGGAYTVIPFLQNDAVIQHAWLSNTQFLDGIALGGILPAPLVIFGTFVGFVGGVNTGDPSQGWLPALAVTLGIFLPAFSFTLIGHTYLEHAVENRQFHNFLDGVTAGVIGLITATTLRILPAALMPALARDPASPQHWLSQARLLPDQIQLPPTWIALAIFAVGLTLLYRWKSKAVVPVLVLTAAAVGFALLRA